MRVFACALAVSFALLASVAPAAAPVRVASLNLCTDELLLLLARPEQIVSVTHLAQDRAESPLWRQARRYRRNDGSLLSVAALRPDLVVTMGGNGADRGSIAQRLGIRMLSLPFAQSLGDVEKSIAAIGKALGRQAQAQRLVARIEALKRTAPRQAVDTVWLGGGGRSVAADGLAAQWMRLGGFRQRSLAGDRLSLEQMLVQPPQILLRSDYRGGQYSGEQRWLSHPVLKRARKSRTLVTDGRRWTCMGPLMIDEIVRLRQVPRP